MPSVATGQPGSNSRGRGGKFRKFTRGGGHHFSRDLRPVDADGNEISIWSADAQKRASGSDEEDDDEEEDEDEEGTASASKAEMTREERKKAKKAQKEAAASKRAAAARGPNRDLPETESDESDEDSDTPANPNHSKEARKQTRAEDNGVADAADGVAKLAVGASRRERESAEALLAKERYRKLHEAGKTDEAKADLARLKLIREKREQDAALKQAEKEEREEQEAIKRAAIEKKEAAKREAALGKAGKKTKKVEKPKASS